MADLVDLYATRDKIDQAGRVFRAGRRYTLPRGAARVMIRRGLMAEVTPDAPLQPDSRKRAKRRAGQSE